MRVWLLVLLFLYTGVLSAEYTVDNAIYDPNGNMKTDQYRSTVLNYDRANQPISITKYHNPGATTYHFGYGIADNRIFKGTMSQAYYYLGSQGIYDINADKWEHYPGGVLRLKNNEIHKIVKDHLSNTRAIVGDNSSCIGLITAYDYYPFGKVLRKHENPVSRFQSTDHEKDSETGYDDRNARLYDDESINFLNVDPKSNDYPAWSPYHYVGRNPITITDPTGMNWYEHKDDEYHQYIWYDGDKDREGYKNLGESSEITGKKGDRVVYKYLLNSDGSTSFQPGGNPILNLKLEIGKSIITDGGSFITPKDYSSNEKGINNVNTCIEEYQANSWMKTGVLAEPPISTFDVITLGRGGLSLLNATKTGERAFFSGAGTEARAIEQGFQTLGQTRAGQNLQNLITSKNIPLKGPGGAEYMWNRLSATWAKGIPNGSSVPVFLNNPRAGSVWLQTELPILQSKGVNLIFK